MSAMSNSDQDITDRRGSLKFKPHQATHRYDIDHIDHDELFLFSSGEFEVACESTPDRTSTPEGGSLVDTMSAIVEGAGVTHEPDLRGDGPILKLNSPSLVPETEISTETGTREELVQRIRQEHADMGVVTVDEPTGDVIAAAHDDHEMTETLMSKDYDEERALTIRIHE